MQAAKRFNLFVDSGVHTRIPRPVCLLLVSAFLDAARILTDFESING